MVGDNAYETTATVKNVGSATKSVVTFAGADCYLQNSDYGFGEYDAATGTVTCRGVLPDSNPPAPGPRIEQFIPLASSSHYAYGYYRDVWQAIATAATAGSNLGDELQGADVEQDNGMALSWSTSLAPGASASFAHLTNFSPSNLQALTTSVTPTPATVGASASVGVALGVSNPNTVDGVVGSLTVTLPDGATYTPGSTTGATTDDPTVSGSTLTYTGPFTVPASGSIAIDLSITGPATDGTATISLAGTAAQVPIIGSSATLTVGGVPPTSPPPTAPPTTPPTTPPATPSPTPTPIVTHSSSATTTTTPVAAVASSGLANTGLDTIGIALVGVLALLVGALVFTLVKMRGLREH